jgi:hypothetical protein
LAGYFATAGAAGGSGIVILKVNFT